MADPVTPNLDESNVTTTGPYISRIKLPDGAGGYNGYEIKDAYARNDFVKAINVTNRHVTYTKGDNSVTEFDVVYKNEELGHGYGICETDEGTAYTVTINNFILKLGGIVVIKFENDVPAETTLNISGTGAKPIHCFGAAVTAGFIKANDTVTFIYDGTNYQVISVIAASNNNIVVGSNKPAYPCTWIETDT